MFVTCLIVDQNCLFCTQEYFCRIFPTSLLLFSLVFFSCPVGRVPEKTVPEFVVFKLMSS